MKSRYDALAIGGGVAGATTAILLAEAGWARWARGEALVSASQGLR